MNYPVFQVFGTQHIVTLMICAAAIYAYIKYFQNQPTNKRVFGGKLIAGIIILHMLTQPFYDVYLFDLPWQGEFPLHMCDFSMLAMIVYLLKDNAPKILFNCAYFWGIVKLNSEFEIAFKKSSAEITPMIINRQPGTK